MGLALNPEHIIFSIQNRKVKLCLRMHPWSKNPGHRSRIHYLSQKKFANFKEFSKIKKIRKNLYKNSLNARVGMAFQQQLKNLMRFTVSCK